MTNFKEDFDMLDELSSIQKSEPEEVCKCINAYEIIDNGECWCSGCGIFIYAEQEHTSTDTCEIRYRQIYNPENRFNDLLDTYLTETRHLPQKIISDFKVFMPSIKCCSAYLNKIHPTYKKYAFELYFRKAGLRRPEVDSSTNAKIRRDFRSLSAYFRIHTRKKSTINLNYCLYRLLQYNKIVFPIHSIHLPFTGLDENDRVFAEWKNFQ